MTYDHEVKASYSVTVRATDPLGASAAAAVTILITNVAEKPLFPSIPVTRSLPENTPPDRNIGEPVSATDPDGYPLIYTLEGVHAAAFDIQASTGQLRTPTGRGVRLRGEVALFRDGAGNGPAQYQRHRRRDHPRHRRRREARDPGSAAGSGT